MRELTSNEMNNVSGGDLASRLEASIVGSVAGFLLAPSGVEPAAVMAAAF